VKGGQTEYNRNCPSEKRRGLSWSSRRLILSSLSGFTRKWSLNLGDCHGRSLCSLRRELLRHVYVLRFGSDMPSATPRKVVNCDQRLDAWRYSGHTFPDNGNSIAEIRQRVTPLRHIVAIDIGHRAPISDRSHPDEPEPVARTGEDIMSSSGKVGARRTAALCFPTPPSEPGMRL
jgi:hypothetical protein